MLSLFFAVGLGCLKIVGSCVRFEINGSIKMT